MDGATMFAALFALGVAALLFGVSIIMPIVSFVRVRSAADEIAKLRARIDELESELRRLTRGMTHAAVGPVAQPPERPAAAPAPAASPAPTVAAATPALPPESRPITAPMAPVPPLPAAVAAPVQAAAPLPESAPPPLPAREPRPPVEPRPPIETAAAMSTSPDASPDPAAGAQDTLETRIGGRWLLYIGTVALVLGIGFFVKYAFDNNWINAVGRVTLGALAGLVMVAGGHRIARRGYPLYGQIVAGGGFGALYVSIYAALNFYGLISRPSAFGLMVLVTAGAAAAADIHRSQGLAWFAVVGGFFTPFLVGGRQDAQVVLLTYDAILVAGTIVMADRRQWPELNLGAYFLTTLTFVGWAGAHYTPAAWLRTELFLLLFCVMFTAAGIRTRRLESHGNAGITSFLLLTAPALFHLGSVANLQEHWLALLVYLTCFSLAGVLASVRFDAPWLRLVVFGATALPLAAWVGEHAGPGWRLAPSIVMLAVYAMNVVAVGERVSRKPDEWPKADIVLVHVNALALFAGLYTIIDAFAPSWSPALAAVLAIWHGALAWSLRSVSAEAGLNSLAMAFAMLGFAIGLKLDDWWSVVGWSVESAAVVWVGLKARREWMRLGGALLFTFSIFNLFMLGFFDAPAGFTPIVNPRVGATLVIVAVAFVLARLHARESARMPDQAKPEIATLWVGGNVLLISLITTEISFYWTMWETVDATANFARQASLSVAWVAYGTALIVAGIMRRYAPIRYLAIGLLALTIGKVFLLDLPQHGGLYRIIGFIGLGAFLLLGAWLYQRYRHVILGGD